MDDHFAAKLKGLNLDLEKINKWFSKFYYLD